MNVTLESLASVLTPVRHVLLDFDGPVCSVFAGFPAPDVALELLRQMPVRTDAWTGESDPLALLRRIGDERPDLAAAADDRLSALEVEAVLRARPTVGGAAFMESCKTSGRRVWMVSNNATAAITRYLSDQGLDEYVSGSFGRVHGHPASMKPSPRLLADAMRAADAKPEECIFIGDAVRDVEAAHAARMSTIGFANKPGKAESLTAAGAIAVVTSMETLARAARMSHS
ncbi:HAD family hydrolase [Streptomyces eurythermus]|uniref:HAD family hydrolase n=1 Tax=Streptomyces eurythermus TaxID=42237 RepID=UPI0033ED9B6A